jgi:TRAP-type C4-dicarboxylate transport system substrate-binding protein
MPKLIRFAGRCATLLIAAAAVFLAPPAARADDPVILRYAMTAPPMSPTVTKLWAPWVEKVNAALAGTATIDAQYGPTLANLGNVYDRLLNNVFAIGYGIHGAVGGRFPKTDLCTLPFLVDDSTRGSVALWRMYERGLFSGEYENVKPLALFLLPQSVVHVNKPIQKLDDFKGVKVGVLAKSQGEILGALGGTPISMNVPDIYPSVSRGVVSGVLVAWTGVLQFKIHEVTNNHLEAALGGGSGFTLMNKDVYERLPQKARDVLDANSGLGLSRESGTVLDAMLADGRATVQKIPGHVVRRIEGDELKQWHGKLMPVVESTTRAVPGGEAILSAFREEIDKARAAGR